MFDGGGDRRMLIIRQLMCERCKHIHSELPDCIVPYKRHCAETIEAVIGGRSEEAPCDKKTAQRIAAWWSVMLPYFLNILKSLTEKFKIIFHDPPAFREIVRAAVGAHSWTFVNSICNRSAVMSG